MFTLIRSLLLITSSLISLSQCYNSFCSPYCSNQSCSSNQSNSCFTAACASPFADLSGTCDITATNILFVDQSMDVGGNLQPSSTNLTSCGPGLSPFQYTFYGYFYGNTGKITFKDYIGVNVPHYRLRVIFWFIMVDQWNKSDAIIVKLNESSTMTMWNINSTINETVCGDSFQVQTFLRYDQTVGHTTSTPYNLSITTNNTNNREWGVKQFIVVALLCNTYCTACTGGAINQCTACDQSNGVMKRSGTTCNESCLSLYGQTLSVILCVKCDNKCVNCYQIATNCTKCTASGANAAYLFVTNNTCMTACPSGYYGNSTDRICYLCSPACLTCRFNSTYCDSCNVTLGYAYYLHTCYYPCPSATFLSTDLKNCTDCSVHCLNCSINSTFCTLCVNSFPNLAYHYANNTCLVTCPDQFYGTLVTTTSICLSCQYTCYRCTDRPSPCQQCNTGYYLYNQICNTTCPSQYFKDVSTLTCLQCSLYCVRVTIQMYFPYSVHQQIYIDVTFSEGMDWGTFPVHTFQHIQIDSPLYEISMFDVQYVVTSGQSYRIVIKPKGYIFLYNISISVVTVSQPTAANSGYESALFRPLHNTCYSLTRSLNWYIIKAPDLSQTQKQIIDKLDIASSQINKYLNMPIVQQIKKSGVLAMLVPGAQIVGCSMLVNHIPAQNVYAGVRFWSSFVIFDAPQWEQDSYYTKYVGKLPIENIINNNNNNSVSRRVLFELGEVYWRFRRTGFTSYFIFDTYPVLALLILSWLLITIMLILKKHRPPIYLNHSPKVYSLSLKCHQLSLMYILMCTLLQWLYFTPSQPHRYLSLTFSLLINIYLLVYNLYIYYEMMKYPTAQIGSYKYQQYVCKYGSILKYIRYQEYDIKKQWSIRNWLRPYNYHVLSYLKKVMMMVGVVVFYQVPYGQPVILIILQVLEIVRFMLTWPYTTKSRNFVKLALQLVLLLFFTCILIQALLITQITHNNAQTIQKSITLYYKIGWLSFVLVFLFNISYIFMYIYDILWVGCRKSNMQLMGEIRREYYYGKLESYEMFNQSIQEQVKRKWVKWGNLENRDYAELQKIFIKIQEIKIRKLSAFQYQISINKLVNLKLRADVDYQRDNNLVADKIYRKFKLTKNNNIQYYKLAQQLFNVHFDNINNSDIQAVTIKTFMLVDQQIQKIEHKLNHIIEQDRNKMNQKVQIQRYVNQKVVRKMEGEGMLKGFPLERGLLAKLDGM